MNTKELRLGNYVTSREKSLLKSLGEKEPFEIIGIEHHQCEVDVGGYGQVILAERFLHPIEITEDWLFKFGYEKFKNDFVGGHNYQAVKNGNPIKLNILRKKVTAWLRGGTIIETTYVHQLQNLFFALTGNELTLTPANQAT